MKNTLRQLAGMVWGNLAGERLAIAATVLIASAQPALFSQEPSPKSADTGTLKDLSEAVNRLKQQVDELRETQSLHASLIVSLGSYNPPVGSVMAYAGDWPPKGVGLADWENVTGWMLCDGRALARNDEAHREIFAAVGTAHGDRSDTGGEGSFRLPDFRGLFLRGVSGETDRDPHKDELRAPRGRIAGADGGNTGNKVGSIQGEATRLPMSPFVVSGAGGHTHKVSGGEHTHSYRIHIDEDDGGSGDRAFATGDGRGGNHRWKDSPYPDEQSNMLQLRAGKHSHSISNEPDHTHQLSGGGDAETRPKNAYVHWIIKYRSTGPQPPL